MQSDRPATSPDTTKRIFIVQPMIGRSGDQIRLIRQIIKDHYEPRGWEVQDSYVKGQNARSKNKRLWLFGRELQTIADCDAVFFAPSAQSYISGMDAHRLCEVHGINIIEYEDVPEIAGALARMEKDITEFNALNETLTQLH